METQEKMRLTASEREAMMRLNVALDILDIEPKHMERRLAEVKYAKRDIRMIVSRLEKIVDELTKTIPDYQLISYRNSLRGLAYRIGIKAPVETPKNEKDYGLWLPWNVINKILEASHYKCEMCALDKCERNKCKLRKALDEIPNDVPHRDNDCPYFSLV